LEITDRHEQVKKLFKDGKTLDEIEQETGYKKNTIKVMLNKAGISYASHFKYDYSKVEEMKNNGMSTAEICNATGITRTCVNNYISKIGKCEKPRIIPQAEKMDDAELESLPHAEPRREYRVVVGKKKYRDVIETLFEEPDIMSI